MLTLGIAPSTELGKVGCRIQPPEYSLLLDSAVRIADPRFAPTQEDILTSKIRTTGVVELQFILEGVKFKYEECINCIGPDGIMLIANIFYCIYNH